MNFAWSAFEVLINLFQGWLFSFFLSRRMRLKGSVTSSGKHIADMCLILSVAAFFSAYIWVEMPISDSFVWGMTLIYSYILFDEKWYIILLWNAFLSALILGLSIGTAELIMRIADITWEQYMQPSLFRVFSVAGSNVIILFVCYFAATLKPRQAELNRRALLLFLFLSLFLFVAMEMQVKLSWNRAVPDLPVFFTIACLLAVSIISLILFELLSHKAERTAELETAIETARLTLKHQQELQAVYADHQQYRHDLKHQFSVLEGILQKGQAQEGHEYLMQLRRTVLMPCLHTGNLAVDAILATKMLCMQELGIEFSYNIYPIDELPIRESLFCSILGNVLDNAIEAIQRMAVKPVKPMVKLSIARVRNVVFITGENDADTHTIKQSGASLYSSKRKNQQGYGIPSIRMIAEKAEGSCTIKVQHNRFGIEIMLPFKQEDIQA